MAKRPGDTRRALTEDELGRIRTRLSTMSMTGVYDFYHAAHLRCTLRDGKAPPAREVQEFVQAWKELRKWNRTEPV